MTLSPSSIIRYRRCPLQWRYHYIDGLPEITGEPAERGRRIHEYLAAAFRGQKVSLPPDEERLAEKALDAFREVHPDATVLGVEMKFAGTWRGETKDFDDPEADFRGIVDLLIREPSGSLIVVDWKTGFSVPDPLQLHLYAYMLSLLSFNVSRVEFVYIDSGGLHAFPPDVDEAKAVVEETIEAIERQQFDPQPGSHCTWCPYIEKCPLANDLSIQPARTIEEASEVLKRAEALAAHANLLRESVRALVKETGIVIPFGSKVFGAKVEESVQVKDEESLRAYLEQMGYDPREFQKVAWDKKKLAAIHLPDEIAVPRQSVRIGFYKPGEV